MLETVLDYRGSMKKIVEHNVSMLQQHSKRTASESAAARKQSKSRNR